MSYTNINEEKGLRYGSLPADTLLYKLEETDPELVGEVAGYDDMTDIEDQYKNYAREEIVDWNPTNGFTEADTVRRDPSLSRGILNLHYNGTRGSYPELPRHPDLFVGFLSNDPRGVDNTPRFDQVRGHIDSRAARLATQFGQNDDNSIAERPWTNQSLSFAQKEVFRRVKGSTKIFTPQKEGRPFGRNVVLDELVGGLHRGSQIGVGQDGLDDTGDAKERFLGGDHGRDDMLGDGVRTTSTPESADTAPWRGSKFDADFEQQLNYGARNRRLGVPGDPANQVAISHVDQSLPDTTVARGAQRQVLAATMALAAATAGGKRLGRHDIDGGRSYQTTKMGRSASPGDVAVVYYAQKEDTDRPEGIERHKLPRSVRPSAHPEEAARSITTSHSAANPHIANVAAIVRGLREGTASSRRKIANQIEASGVRITMEKEGTARRGVERARDNARIARLSQANALSAAAAKGLAVHQYKSAPRPSGRDVRGNAKTDAEFGAPSKLVRHGKIAERKTMFPVTAPVTLSDEDAATFGVDAAPASRSVVGIAKAPLRNGDRGEDIERRDSDGLGDTF